MGFGPAAGASEKDSARAALRATRTAEEGARCTHERIDEVWQKLAIRPAVKGTQHGRQIGLLVALAVARVRVRFFEPRNRR